MAFPIDPANVDYHEIARRGDTQVMAALLGAGLDPDLRDPGDARGYTLLMIAAYHDQREMVELLLDHGADVDAADTSGNTPLMGLCFKGHADLAATLLDRGADANARNGSGATPLMLAAMFHQPAIMRALLDHGADASLANGQGHTAADLARFHGHADLIPLLQPPAT